MQVGAEVDRAGVTGAAGDGPGRAPVCSAPSTTRTPLTRTCSTPRAYTVGFSRRRDVVELVVVEHDDVGAVARPQEAAIPEAEVRRRHARHLPDRLLQAQRALLAHVVGEVVDVAGEAERVLHDLAQRARVLDRERVDAEAEERMADHLRQVLVGEERPDREDRLVVRAGVGEDVEVALPRVLAELLRDLPEVQPAELGVLRSRLEVHALPLALVDEAPVAVALVAHPLAERRVAQLRRRSLRPVLGHPRRQDPGHLAEALAERGRVGEDVESRLAARRHLLDRALPAPLRRVRVVADVQVRDLRSRAPGPGDREELVDRLEQARVAVADVARVDAVVLAGDGVQAHQLLGRRLPARVELEPGRHPERSRLHRLVDEALHRRHAARRSASSPDTPAASRIALWPTNQAKFGVWPTSERNSRCSPKVDHGIVGLSNPNECSRLRIDGLGGRP